MPLLPDLRAAEIRGLPGLDRDDLRIIEIGANDGTDTKEFLNILPDGHITCFECDPRAIALWHKLIAGDPRAYLYEVALGDTVGKMPFYQSGGKPPWANKPDDPPWDKSGSLLQPDKHVQYQPWLSFPDVIAVTVATLDAIGPEVAGGPNSPNIIDFVWCDAQGAEAAILRGAQQTIRRIRYWYCEVHALPYYKGQATLDEITKLLPGFKLYSSHAGENHLFYNEKL